MGSVRTGIGWLDSFYRNADIGCQPVMLYETERFALVKLPGHSYWKGGYAEERVYVRQQLLCLRKSGNLWDLSGQRCMARGRWNARWIGQVIDLIREGCERTGNLPDLLPNGAECLSLDCFAKVPAWME